MLNAMMHVIVDEGLVDQASSPPHHRLRGAEAEPRGLQPRADGADLRHPAETLREVARLYATSRASMILWGMGVSQHVHGTDNARCLIALALITGQIGRPGTGLHPLRGQNNVQGASDAGLIPMMYPDYQKVVEPEVRARFEKAWKLRPARWTPSPA
jgi:formate dehydrogenase major subunit